MQQRRDNLKGALFMMGSMAAFTINDAFMKSLSDQLPLFQAIFLRGIATSAMMLTFVLVTRRLDFNISGRDWKLIAVRTAAEVAAAYLFISALFNMPIANATAILQALPLTVTLAGALFFGEAVGWRRMLAIIVGFIGVILIVKPGAEGFNAYSTNVVLAVLAVTVRDLAARRLSAKVPSMTVAVFTAVAVTTAFGIASCTDTWVMPGISEWMQLGAASVFIMGGYLFSIMTMRVGDLGTVAPFRYTSLLWALILGLVVFGDWPDLLTLLGSAIVVASGVFTLIREQRLARRGHVAGVKPR